MDAKWISTRMEIKIWRVMAASEVRGTVRKTVQGSKTGASRVMM